MNVMLLSTSGWMHTCRYPKPMARAGFKVAACMQAQDPLGASRFLGERHATLDLGKPVQSHNYPRLLEAVQAFGPRLLIPVDETAIELMTKLHGDPQCAPLHALLEASKGDPAHYQTVRSKHRSTALARELGIRTPAERPLPSFAELGPALAELGLPIVLKDDQGCSGAGVRVCLDTPAAEAAFLELGTRPRADMVAQQHVDGHPGFTAAVAWRGRMLACVTAEKLEQFPPVTGPCAVARVREHAEMREATRRYVEATGFTGFLGLDFMLDAEDRSWFLECSARPAPLTSACLHAGVDLFAALHAAMAGAPHVEQRQRDATIAFFPKELLRDLQSPYLYSAIHDVPWDEPELLLGYLNAFPWPKP